MLLISWVYLSRHLQFNILSLVVERLISSWLFLLFFLHFPALYIDCSVVSCSLILSHYHTCAFTSHARVQLPRYGNGVVTVIAVFVTIVYAGTKMEVTGALLLCMWFLSVTNRFSYIHVHQRITNQ